MISGSRPTPFKTPASIPLDAVPAFSSWPAELLRGEARQFKKTGTSVLKEYEHGKWGPLLAHVKAHGRASLATVERLFSDGAGRSPAFVSGKFYLATERQMLAQHLDLYAHALSRHIRGASCLAELGAGFGSKILRLARRKGLGGLPLYAYELTPAGRELISTLARVERKPVQVGSCDFRALQLHGPRLPADSLIFTSYSLHYIPRLSRRLVEFFLRLRPRAVVHFEPCYEFYPEDSLHGLMCRRYVELNDYTRNLASLLSQAERDGRIRMSVKKNILGSNPFLPISIIEWTPKP